MFIGSTQTLDIMSCLLVMSLGLAKLLGLEPSVAPFSNICDIEISFTNNTTEKLPDAKQSTAQHSDAMANEPNGKFEPN